MRASAEYQRRVAASVTFEPLSDLLSHTADWTRDLGAATASIARWVLDA